MHKSRGFTLLEVMIVVTLLGIVAAVIFASFNRGTAQSRDTQRMADLRNLQTAIELYKQENGRYPEGCRGAGQWSGQKGTDYECNNNTGIYAPYFGTGQYIIGHEAGISFAPKFIRTLPKDPKLNGANSGYAYLVNAEGTVYKLVAYRTVEVLSVVDLSLPISKIVPEFSMFKLCPADGEIGDSSVLCVNTNVELGFGGNTPPYCNFAHEDFQTSYALWGGYADETSDVRVKRFTERVVCMKP